MSKLAHSNDATMFEIEKARLRIKTTHQFPPIPIRAMDWCAYYDGEEESCQYGYGHTEREAVADLIENYPPDERGEP